MESNEWEKENTDIWGISREKTEFLFNNTIKVLLEDEKNETFDLASYETPST